MWFGSSSLSEEDIKECVLLPIDNQPDAQLPQFLSVDDNDAATANTRSSPNVPSAASTALKKFIWLCRRRLSLPVIQHTSLLPPPCGYRFHCAIFSHVIVDVLSPLLADTNSFTPQTLPLLLPLHSRRPPCCHSRQLCCNLTFAPPASIWGSPPCRYGVRQRLTAFVRQCKNGDDEVV